MSDALVSRRTVHKRFLVPLVEFKIHCNVLINFRKAPSLMLVTFKFGSAFVGVFFQDRGRVEKLRTVEYIFNAGWLR
jgi:hypothetical protein